MSTFSDISNGPFMPNPKGSTFNFSSEESMGSTLVATCSVVLALMILFVAVRSYAAFVIRKKVYWSDVACFVGFLFTLAYYATCIIGVNAGYVGRHSWDASVGQLLESSFFLTSYLQNILCPAGLGFIKLSYFLLYLQLFAPLGAMRIAIWVGGSLSTIFYMLVVILSFVFDTPRKGETFATHTASRLATQQIHMSVPLAAISLVLDLYILILPIAGVWQLQLPTFRKIGVAMVFFTGAMACLASMLTLYYRVRIQTTDDILWLLVPTLITTLVEMEIGVICSCAPAISQTLREHLPPYEVLKSKIFASLPSTRRSRATDSGSPSSRGSDSHPSKEYYQVHDYPLLKENRSGSQHAIELGNQASVKTTISGSGPAIVEGDGIWMERQVQQQRVGAKDMV